MRITTVRIITQIIIMALFMTLVFTTTMVHLDRMPTLRFWLSKFLEINPLPTFAPNGSFGILAELEGCSLSEMLGRCIAAGLARLGFEEGHDRHE